VITINGRFVARAVMYVAGAAFLVLAGFSYDANRITVRAVILGAVVLAIGTIAALWLWRHPSQGGQA
jgi:hypothetical protein